MNHPSPFVIGIGIILSDNIHWNFIGSLIMGILNGWIIEQ